MTDIADNLARVNDRIAAAAARADRDPAALTLVAVSKTWPAERIAEAAEAGQIDFGENKVQELIAKAPALPDHLCWHLIGHLQKNKVRKVLPLCGLIHSVDSLDLARRIDRIAGEESLRCEGLLQVNVAGDDAKFGFSVEEAREAFAEIAGLEQLAIRGLMTVPAYDEDPEKVRPHFARLRDLRDELAEASGLDLPELSMGMSHDFEVAIEEGATLVRVGSAIFGQRDYSNGG